jgi:protein TonB
MSRKETQLDATKEVDAKDSAGNFVPYKTRGYGAPELKQFYQKFMFRGVIIGAVIVGAIVGLYYVPQLLASEEEPIHTIRLMKYTDLGPPPSITQTAAAPSVAMASTAVKPSIGIPVPVPDAEVNPEQTFATQQELSQAASPASEGTNTGTGVSIQPDLNIDEPPPDFVPYEKEPTVVRKIEPKYPEIALRAGLEGNVFLKVWVTKEGKVREAVIIKSDAEIFNQAAKDAAIQWVFTPAVMQKGPVAVWVSIPFRFRLTGK